MFYLPSNILLIILDGLGGALLELLAREPSMGMITTADRDAERGAV
jgi:hypothetical protein